MTWIICAAIAVVMGFILYSSIESELPESLAVLKIKDSAQVAVAASGASEGVMSGGWNYRSDGKVVEVSKKFNAGPEISGVVYDAPVVAFMCDGTALYARIDTRARTTGMPESELAINGRAQNWPKAEGTNLLAPNAILLLRDLTSAKATIPVELSYVEIGRHTLEIDTTGLTNAVSQFPQACR